MTDTFYVKPCWNSEYKGVKCLEMEDSYGFFTSKNDIRPSSCNWIKKNKVENLTQKNIIDFIDFSK